VVIADQPSFETLNQALKGNAKAIKPPSVELDKSSSEEPDSEEENLGITHKGPPITSQNITLALRNMLKVINKP